MGVACGDADGDQRLDLFVTNFARESNTLYHLEETGFFTDITWRAGLKIPGYSWLGFGTQFLDVDLDGDLDLVLTNGHVDDVRHLNQPYCMPPQFFLNVSHGDFSEIPADMLGGYFQEKYLGRGLVRVDWNLDGLDDFAVSHLDAPAALMTNVTPSDNDFLAVRLKGIASDSDSGTGRPKTRQTTDCRRRLPCIK